MFLLQENLLLPFLATLGASVAIITINPLSRHVKEQKQRIYAAHYMLDTAYTILLSTLIVKKHTIIPHIEATKKIISGDDELLEKTLLADEFDILKTKSKPFSHLPNDFKVLVGYDDIKLVQVFDTLLYLNESEENRFHLNEFVKINLKSMNGFLSLDSYRRKDILNTYWDILDSLNHEANHILCFVRDAFLPILKLYINRKRFLLFRTSKVKKTINAIEKLIFTNKESFPEPDYMKKVKHGGIQRAL